MISAMMMGGVAEETRAVFDYTTDGSKVSTIPFGTDGTNDYTIYWGDGSNDSYTSGGLKTHTYSSVGTYTIKIEGQCSIKFQDTSYIGTLEDFTSFGEVKWQSCVEMFRYTTVVSFSYIDAPDLSECTDCSMMFRQNTTFNKDVSSWDISTILDMGSMFYGSNFNNGGVALTWDMSNVTNINTMFSAMSAFNQDVSSWDTSSVETMEYTFNNNTGFNQDVFDWDTSSVTTFEGFNAGTSVLEDKNCPAIMFPYIMDVKTDNLGNTNDDQFSLYINSGGTNNFTVDWGDTNKNTYTTDGVALHTYSASGTYEIKIYGRANVEFGGNGDATKMTSVDAMGTVRWQSGADLFSGCLYAVFTFTDVPNLSEATTLNGMFSDASLFNQDIGAWDVSSIQNMGDMFYLAEVFNQDISDWDMSSVALVEGMFGSAHSFNNGGVALDWADTGSFIDTTYMFYGTEAFNQDLSSWDTGNVVSMGAMFQGATAFNQDISSWDVGKVNTMAEMFGYTEAFNNGGVALDWADTSSLEEMYAMFEEALVFNQDISSWDTSAVTDMDTVFMNAGAFNQDISAWDIDVVEYAADFAENAPLTDINNPFAYCKFKATPDSSAKTLEITIRDDAPSVNMTIYWGDGTSDFYNTTGTKQHTYADDSQREIRVSGTSLALRWYAGAGAGDIDHFTTFGIVPSFSIVASMFYNKNITWSPLMRDINLNANCVNVSGMFYSATGFNVDISSWDMSNAEDFNSMFKNNNGFNQDISTWNVTSATVCDEFRLNSDLDCVNTPALSQTCTGC